MLSKFRQMTRYLLTQNEVLHKIPRLNGAIAQLGERVNGIHEVGSSILPGSTTFLSRNAHV